MSRYLIKLIYNFKIKYINSKNRYMYRLIFLKETNNEKVTTKYKKQTKNYIEYKIIAPI